MTPKDTAAPSSLQSALQQGAKSVEEMVEPMMSKIGEVMATAKAAGDPLPSLKIATITAERALIIAINAFEDAVRADEMKGSINLVSDYDEVVAELERCRALMWGLIEALTGVNHL